jgi:hypothetical protein
MFLGEVQSVRVFVLKNIIQKNSKICLCEKITEAYPAPSSHFFAKQFLGMLDMEETSSNSHPGFLSSFAAGGFLFSYSGKSTIWGILIGNFFLFCFSQHFSANLTDGWSLSLSPSKILCNIGPSWFPLKSFILLLKSSYDLF